MKLKDREHVVAAWGENARGPGWKNWPIWVLICSANSGYRLDCLQPEEQTNEMRVLFEVSAVVIKGMTASVNNKIYQDAKKIQDNEALP